VHPGYSAAFIAQYSKTFSFKNEVELHSLPSAIPKKINLGAISNIRIKLPPTLQEQTAIAEMLSDMDAELAALKERREKTRALKQAMMQELLTGKTRLV
jgi:type I restriction enzyme, S subunit